MLEIDHLTKRFDDKVAVDDLTLHIAPGEVYGFIGHTASHPATYGPSPLGGATRVRDRAARVDSARPVRARNDP